MHIAGCEEVTSDRISLALREKMMAALKKERTGYIRTDKLSHSMLTRWWHQSYISGLFQHKVGRLSEQAKDKHRLACSHQWPRKSFAGSMHAVNTCFTIKVMNVPWWRKRCRQRWRRQNIRWWRHNPPSVGCLRLTYPVLELFSGILYQGRGF